MRSRRHAIASVFRFSGRDQTKKSSPLLTLRTLEAIHSLSFMPSYCLPSPSDPAPCCFAPRPCSTQVSKWHFSYLIRREAIIL
jgi:hypothetical protein